MRASDFKISASELTARPNSCFVRESHRITNPYAPPFDSLTAAERRAAFGDPVPGESSETSNNDDNRFEPSFVGSVHPGFRTVGIAPRSVKPRKEVDVSDDE